MVRLISSDYEIYGKNLGQLEDCLADRIIDDLELSNSLLDYKDHMTQLGTSFEVFSQLKKKFPANWLPSVGPINDFGVDSCFTSFFLMESTEKKDFQDFTWHDSCW